jgi:hypothetical protein
MKRFFTISLLFVTTLGFSQDYTFRPLWTKGDVKHVSMTQVEKEYEDDILIFDTTVYNEARITVLKENKTHYTLEILMENQALSKVKGFYDKLGEELKEYKNLKLIYSIDKETAEYELLNWKDAQKFMTNSLKQINKITKNKVPDSAPFIRLILMPLNEIFKSKENIESYMSSNIEYILIPFNTRFKIGETITKTKSQENPFNPRQEISETTLLTLESVNEGTKTCIINKEVEVDLTEFIAMMNTMIQKMSKSFGENDSITTKKSLSIDEFEMDIENLQIITFDYETTWITRIEGKGLVLGTDPEKGIKTKNQVTTTMIIE